MEKREPLYTVGGSVNCRATMENSMAIPQEIKNRTIVWPRNLTTVYISKGNKIIILKKYLYSHVHCSIIHNSQGMETMCLLMEKWTKKKIYIYPHRHNGILFNLKIRRKSHHLQHYGWTWGGIMLSKINQAKKPEKDKYCMVITYMELSGI